jgi:hypothetical protein
MFRDGQAPPAPDVDVDVDVDVDGDDAGALLSPPDEPESPARFFLPPLLKSVSYQPPPFNRKPAALILRFSCGSPHCGQTDRGSSENFCSFSSS